MKYPRSQKYDTPELMSKIMGPNPVKLEEELLLDHKIPAGATVDRKSTRLNSSHS